MPTKGPALRAPRLTPRLAAVASLVRPGVVAADIGTDHAHVTAFQTATGRCPHAIACDIRPGPLASTRATLRRFGAESSVELRLAPGLTALAAGEADDIILAGMGGELIASILMESLHLIGGSYLILQPMTAQERLRAALCEAGFELLAERVAQEGGKLYLIQLAQYTGKLSIPDPLFCETGLLSGNADALSAAWLRKSGDRHLLRAQGMRRAGRLSEQAVAEERLAAKLHELAAAIESRSLWEVSHGY